MELGRDGFRALLSGFREAGYRFRLFEDTVEDRSVMLRHDVDFSVEHAAELARVEHAEGVAATYFFMLSSNFYNPLSGRNRALIEEIKQLGHTVSLHFDASIHADVDAGFAAEKATFENAFGPIEIVSLHRPGPFLQNRNRKLGDVRHTYEDALFSDIKYCSDSGGAFDYGHPFDDPAFATGRPIHLLLHPIWWTTREGSPSEKLREWKLAHLEFLREQMSANCRTFDGHGIVAQVDAVG